MIISDHHFLQSDTACILIDSENKKHLYRTEANVQVLKGREGGYSKDIAIIKANN